MELLAVFAVGTIPIGIIVLILWTLAEILRKAGFSRWYAPVIVVSGLSGLIVLAAADWPVYRELAWLRLRAGRYSEKEVARIERYALDLEMRGDWTQAIEVYEELGRRAAGEAAVRYYQNSVTRLSQRIAEAKAA